MHSARATHIVSPASASAEGTSDGEATQRANPLDSLQIDVGRNTESLTSSFALTPCRSANAFPQTVGRCEEQAPHTNPSTLRPRRSAERRRAGRQPASGGNAARGRRRRPQTGARRVSAGLGAGLRNTPAPLGAGFRRLVALRERRGRLRNAPEGVALIRANRARSVVPLSAMCPQRARYRKTEEVSRLAERVVCRFESARSVPNVPATGKEGRDD